MGDVLFKDEDLKYLDKEETRELFRMRESVENLKKISNKRFCSKCGHIMSEYRPRHLLVYVCGYCLNMEDDSIKN